MDTRNEGSKHTIIVNNNERKSNSAGTTGLVLSIIALVLFCVPFLNWILWFLGAIFSFIGIFKKPRGNAIAGLIISFIGLIVLILLIVGLFGLSTLSSEEFNNF